MSSDVIELLTQKNIKFKRQGADVLVHCLNPDHNDTSPSLRINHQDGKFNCLSCGFKGNIFSYFNKYRNTFNSKVTKAKEKVLEIRRASWGGLAFPQDALFVRGDWGNIPSRVVEHFQGFTSSDWGMEGRVVFPVYDQTNRMVAVQGRYIYTDVSPKYIFYPPKVSMPWYPNQLMVEPHNNSIILVEGLRDMMWLYSLGYKNAVCLFGTKSVSIDNILDRLTPYMLRGVDTVIIMTDGDTAGRSAAEHIKMCIERKTDVVVKVAELPEGKDPASLTKEEIKLTLSNVYK